MNYGQYSRDLLRTEALSPGAAGNTNNTASEPAFPAYNDGDAQLPRTKSTRTSFAGSSANERW
jgi:hypothetical protein